MTIIESVTLMLALVYIGAQLFWSGHKYGAYLTVALTFIAIIISMDIRLILAIGISQIVFLGVSYAKPQLFTNEVRINTLRNWVQHIIAISLLLSAVQYTIYHFCLQNDIESLFLRPHILDAFLPLAGAFELRELIEYGYWDPYHPAAVVMLSIVMLTGLCCKRAFCGWACPLGLLGEYLYKIRYYFFKKECLPPSWLDWLLRAVKYLLLFIACYSVIILPSSAVLHYLNGSCHQIADCKMALFFVSPGILSLTIFGFVLLLSAWRQQGFCRYVCPYGALLGLLSLLSPLKIRRDPQYCVDSNSVKCNKCTQACPANIKVHQCITVVSDECQACLKCVAACPNKKALGLKFTNGVRVCHRNLTIMLLIILFGLPLIAYLCGYWESSGSEYVSHYLTMNLESFG